MTFENQILRGFSFLSPLSLSVSVFLSPPTELSSCHLSLTKNVQVSTLTVRGDSPSLTPGLSLFTERVRVLRLSPLSVWVRRNRPRERWCRCISEKDSWEILGLYLTREKLFSPGVLPRPLAVNIHGSRFIRVPCYRLSSQ